MMLFPASIREQQSFKTHTHCLRWSHTNTLLLLHIAACTGCNAVNELELIFGRSNYKLMMGCDQKININCDINFLPTSSPLHFSVTN